MIALPPFLLFFALLGVVAVACLIAAAVSWVARLRHTPSLTDAELRVLVRREFERPPSIDLDEGMRQLAALIIPKGSR